MARKSLNTQLTLGDLKTVALIAFRNAEELLADAELLHHHQRYPRTIFLVCIATEELGKARLALELYSAKWEFDTDFKIKNFWRFWRDHLSKVAHGEGFLSLEPEVMEQHASDLLPAGYSNWQDYEEKRRAFFVELSKNTVKIKEASLYVDLIRGSGQSQGLGFRLPSANLKREHSEKFIQGFREKIKALKPEFQKLDWLNVPFYPPDEYEEALLQQALLALE